MQDTPLDFVDRETAKLWHARPDGWHRLLPPHDLGDVGNLLEVAIVRPQNREYVVIFPGRPDHPYNVIGAAVAHVEELIRIHLLEMPAAFAAEAELTDEWLFDEKADRVAFFDTDGRRIEMLGEGAYLAITAAGEELNTHATAEDAAASLGSAHKP